MIFSSLAIDDNLGKYPESIQTALRYLSSKDFTAMECGTYPIRGNEIYALVQQLTTVPAEEKKPEKHKKYLDIQYLVTGEEKYGYKIDDGSDPVVSAKEEKDIYFYGELENENYLVMKPNEYCIFFPEDIHRPGCSVNDSISVRKVVVKISEDSLYR